MSQSDFVSFSFCQVSDLNLDSSASMSLHLSPSQRKQRSEESIEALAAAIKVAISNDVNAVLIPGNLFDAENVSTSTLASVQKIFARLQEIPVFIAPGAADPLHSDSLYDESVLRARGLEPWSDNVHIFGANNVHSFNLPGKDSIKISGIGLTKDNRGRMPYIPELQKSEKAAINILLLPLGLADAATEKSKNELGKKFKSRGYSYIAFSGFKNQSILKSEEDEVIFAGASGTFVGLTAKELGPRTAIFANLDRRMSAGIEMTMHTEEFDPRRIINIDFDISGRDPNVLSMDLEKEIKESGARKDIDVLLINASGLYPVGADVKLITEQMKSDYFHLKSKINIRPDYLQSISLKNQIESKYACILGALRNELHANMERDSEKVAIITDALYFGLEAIREGTVSTPNAD